MDFLFWLILQDTVPNTNNATRLSYITQLLPLPVDTILDCIEDYHTKGEEHHLSTRKEHCCI